MFSTKILTIIPMLLASNITGPNPSIGLNSTVPSNTPYVDMMCMFQSNLVNKYSKADEISQYQCLCKDFDEEMKLRYENILTLGMQLGMERSPLLKVLSETFTHVSDDLEAEFDAYDHIVEYVNGLIDDAPEKVNFKAIDFVFENQDMPVVQFSVEYANLLLKYILEKYEADFQKLERMNIPNMLDTELALIKCKANYFYKTKQLKNVFDAAEFINQGIMRLFKTLSIDILSLASDISNE